MAAGKSVGFQFTEKAVERLDRLSKFLECSKTQTLERLLRAADDVLKKDRMVIEITESADALLESVR
jgi:hypothetical protein